MSRCQSCNKFVSNDDSNEPEVDLELSDDGNITGMAHIAICCAECGDELKTADFDLEEDVSDKLEAHLTETKGGDAHGSVYPAEMDVVSSELTTRCEGKGRGTKTFYGVKTDVEVTCKCKSCEKNPAGAHSFIVTLEADIQASGMYECR